MTNTRLRMVSGCQGGQRKLISDDKITQDSIRSKRTFLSLAEALVNQTEPDRCYEWTNESDCYTVRDCQNHKSEEGARESIW